MAYPLYLLFAFAAPEFAAAVPPAATKSSDPQMRKEEDVLHARIAARIAAEKARDNVAIAIESQGHVSTQATSKEGLHAASVQAHEQSTLTHQKFTNQMDVALPCGSPANWHVQIKTTWPASSSAAKSSARSSHRSGLKTLQFKGCHDDTFQFEGCSTTGDSARMCIQSEKASSGVRVLMNSRNLVVGYGSCCSDDQAVVFDEVVQSKAILVSEQHDVQKASSLSTAPATAAIEDEDLWTSLPMNANSVEQGLLLMTHKYRMQALIGCCLSMTLVAVAASASLMWAHFKAGRRLTCGRYTPHPSTTMFVGLLCGLPVLAILGLAGLVLPEMVAIWQFLQALIVASTLRKMPEMLMQAAGGRMQVQRGLQSHQAAPNLTNLQSQESAPHGSPVRIFTQWPFGFLQRCLPLKAPEITNIDEVQWGVAILCTLMPLFSFLEMFFSLEATLATVPGSLAQSHLLAATPVIITAIRVVQVLFIKIGIVAVHGLGMVLQTLNPKTCQEMNMGFKQLYCMLFLSSLRLLPILCNLYQYAFSQQAAQDEASHAGPSALVCAASLICSIVGWRAFPPDDQHYRTTANSAAALQQGAQQQGALKPVLENVKFCPFCGSSELEFESDGPSSDNVACAGCGSRQMPPYLVIHRAGALPPAGKSAATEFPHGLGTK